MAKWSKNKVEPDSINSGNEFTKDNNFAIDELNAIVNNSFYASDKAKEALDKANDFIVEQRGTSVTLNGNPQSTWSADFAESERQKSKNLFNKYGSLSDYIGYKTGETILQSDGRIKATSNNSNGTGKGQFIALKPNTTYSISFDIEEMETTGNSVISVIAINNDGSKGDLLKTKNFSVNGNYSFNFTTSTNKIWLSFNGISNPSELTSFKYVVYNNVQLEKGEQATDYQEYNGEIVHEKRLLTRSLVFEIEKTIDINNSILTTLNEYYDLFNHDKSVMYFAQIGEWKDTKVENDYNFKKLVGKPEGFGNFVGCCIKPFCVENVNGRHGVFELMAINYYAGGFAKGYIYKNRDTNGNNEVRFTGWQIIGG